MKYPYTVIKDGITYPPNTDIPEVVKTQPVDNSIENTENIETPENAENAEKTDEEAKEGEDSVDNETDAKMTRTQLNRMPILELRRFAEENGVKNVDAKVGTELKRELIAKLGL